MSERVELPSEDLAKYLPGIKGTQSVTFSFEGEWFDRMTPQQVMKLAGHKEWAELQEGDVVDLAVFGRDPRAARVTVIAFNAEGELSYTFEWVD